MAYFLPCPPGEPISCAIHEVAEAISNGPSAFTVWATLIVPIFAALASTAVAVVSATIAKKARDIAAASEDARVDAENERIDREYRARMHEAFIELFEDVGRLAEALEVYGSYLSNAAQRGEYVSAQDRKSPSDLHLLGKIASARLLAKETDEVELLNAIRGLTLQSRPKEFEVRAAVLAEVWPIVILWQNADAAKRRELLGRFNELHAMESLEHAPSWVAVEEARV